MSTSTPESAATRVSSFIQTNRRAVFISALSILVVAGGAWYYLSSPPPPSRKDRKSKKKREKDGESSKVEVGKSENKEKSKVKAEESYLEASEEDIVKLSKEDRKARALALKTSGNRFYSARDFTTALTYYSKALDYEQEAVYYSNRAACYTNLGDTENVIKDCTKALELDKFYVKALNRRAGAWEARGGLDGLEEAVCDYTMAAILDEFQNEQTAKKVDAAVKRLAAEKAKEVIATREPVLPSVNFIRAYLEAFRPSPFPPLPESPTQGDQTLEIAFGAIKAGDYIHAFTLLGEALDQGIEDDERRGLARVWRGTFWFIMGDAKKALEDIQVAMDIFLNLPVDESEQVRKRRKKTLVQAYIKRASVHMELGEPGDAMRDFDEAEKVDENDPDVWYHRGQVFFIMSDFESAMKQYERSITLDDKFIFAHIQLAVAMYKVQRVAEAMASFLQVLKNFPGQPEGHNYYGEVLLDQGNFGEAITQFQKSFTLEESRSTSGVINVIPLINQAMCILQSTSTTAPSSASVLEAEGLCRKALELDPLCDIAINTLAQLLLQQNRVDEASLTFEKAAERARTEGELVQTWCFVYASRAQKRFIENYPAFAEKVGMAGQR